MFSVQENKNIGDEIYRINAFFDDDYGLKFFGFAKVINNQQAPFGIAILKESKHDVFFMK